MSSRIVPVSKTARWSTSPPDSVAHITSVFAPELDKMGFKLAEQTQDRLVFRYRYLPAPGVFLGLITLPIGLLFWAFWRREEDLTFTLTPDGDGSRLLIAGRCTDGPKRYVEAIPDTAALNDVEPATAPSGGDGLERAALGSPGGDVV